MPAVSENRRYIFLILHGILYVDRQGLLKHITHNSEKECCFVLSDRDYGIWDMDEAFTPRSPLIGPPLMVNDSGTEAAINLKGGQHGVFSTQDLIKYESDILQDSLPEYFDYPPSCMNFYRAVGDAVGLAVGNHQGQILYRNISGRGGTLDISYTDVRKGYPIELIIALNEYVVCTSDHYFYTIYLEYPCRGSIQSARVSSPFSAMAYHPHERRCVLATEAGDVMQLLLEPNHAVHRQNLPQVAARPTVINYVGGSLIVGTLAGGIYQLNLLNEAAGWNKLGDMGATLTNMSIRSEIIIAANDRGLLWAYNLVTHRSCTLLTHHGAILDLVIGKETCYYYAPIKSIRDRHDPRDVHAMPLSQFPGLVLPHPHINGNGFAH